MNDLIVLKIGGSICTEKSSGKFRVKKVLVSRIAREIKEAGQQKKFRLLVVNGAGPFGHVNVKNYDINDGLHTPRDFEGFVKTVCDCDSLNYSVTEILRKAGLLAYPFPSSSVAIQSGKKLVSLYMDVVKMLWNFNEGIIPVMNGTMTADIRLRGSVVSGDAVIEHIARRMMPRRIIFATDVDGIFMADPKKNKKARLIRRITKENFDGLKRGIKGSSSVDVTGGMLNKVERLLDTGAETIIVNGRVPGRIKAALSGEEVKGTVISGKSPIPSV